MAKTRLTNYLRDQICSALIQHATEKRTKQLKAREAALFKACIYDLYGKAMLAKIARLPSDWFRSTTRAHVNAGGWAISLSGEPVRMPYHCEDASAIKDPVLIEKVRLWATETKEHHEARDKLRNQVRSVLLSAGTVEYAIELMPDMGKVIQTVIKAQPAPAEPTALVVTAGAVVQQIEQMRTAA